MPPRKKLAAFLRNRRVQKVLGVVAACLCVYFLFDNILMPLYTRQGSERAVPQLVGLPRDEALKMARTAGFAVLEDPPKIGVGAVEGTIIEQHPFSGSLAKPGRKIRIVPAAKPAGNIAPDLVGLDLRDAQLRCKNIGLFSGDSEVRYRFTDKTPKGVVVGQEPAAGKKVEPGSVVKITVSMGPQPDHFYAPALMEKSLAEARVMIREAGLKLGKIARKETDKFTAGTVIGQSIVSGSEVNKDAAIDIVVAVKKSAN
jgi:serine/threonine-protein kinase